MITEIGLTAGEIWHHLDAHEGKASLKDIISDIKISNETILMALGWLAREGYVLIEGVLPEIIIKLNPNPPAKKA